MKRILLTVMVAAFAVAVQAGDAKTSQDKVKDKPSCCPSKGEAGDQAKGGCPFAKGACGKKAQAKQAGLQSPKAADAVK